jgi:hypothetical protein
MIPAKQWFEPFPWEAVVDLNLQFCNAAKTPHELSKDAHKATRELWEKTRVDRQTLREALMVCRQCHQLAPFRYYNGNTFAAIARTLSQQICIKLKPTKAHIFRSAVGHYVAGTIEPPEFESVYRSVEKTLISGDTQPIRTVLKK